MDEKQKIEETIIKNLKNEVTILENLPHGKGIISEMNYITIEFDNIFNKIEGYDNPYEGIIRLEKKRKRFGNNSLIDDFKRDEYNYEKNIRTIVKDEIDDHFEWYCHSVSRYIKEIMSQQYIAQELHINYDFPLHRVEFDSIPDNMEYEEYECSNGLANRLRERLLQQMSRY